MAADSGMSRNDQLLFWACFIALVTTAFGFIIRTLLIKEWGVEFGLDETEKGKILGVGLWPFAVSIVLVSLVVDRIGYGKAMIIAFLCHGLSAILIILANGYWMLYVGTLILALGSGTVEAVINPVVATMFSKQKTKWLNILHAGWPGGLVLGGVIALLMGAGVSWKLKVGLMFIPTIIYGLMMLGRKFPVHERVAAGVSYRDMLREAGIIGWAIAVVLMVRQVGSELGWGDTFQIVLMVVIIAIYGVYVRSLGRPMFILLLLIMIPLATTELGTDSWITDLVEPVMEKLGPQAGWVLVYTSLIMMVLRLCAGPIVHALPPLGLLAICSAIAAVGLIALSKSTGMMIFAAATIYGVGKTFFWPTMLGVAAERFPKGGALTINAVGGVGMLGVGVIGTVLLGNIQDKAVDRELMAQNPQLHGQAIGPEKLSIFGKYRSLDKEKVGKLGEEEAKVIKGIQDGVKKGALATVAIFPAIMLICYLGMILYFKAKGGYSAVDLAAEGAQEEAPPEGSAEEAPAEEGAAEPSEEPPPEEGEEEKQGEG